MDTISFLLICAILLFPMLFLISVAKAIQPPVRKSRYAKLSREEHLEHRQKVSAVLLPFPENKHNEQEPTQQSNKTMTATYLNNLLDLKKFLNKFTDEELQSQDCFVLNYKEEDRDYPGTYHLKSKDIQYVAINQWNIEFYEDKESLNM